MSGTKKPSRGAQEWMLGWLYIVGFVAVVIVFISIGASAENTGTSNAVFGPRESGRLIERLDAAAKAQGICYGWKIDTDQYNYAPVVTPSYSGTFQPSPIPYEELAEREAGVEIGSNLGVSTDPSALPQRCPKWVVFKADYVYSSIDEEWTSVYIDVASNFPQGPSTADLAAVGITTSSLLGDDATARLADAIGVLPVIVAERGGAPAVAENSVQTPPAGDQISRPGNGRYVVPVLGAIATLGGLALIVTAVVRGRRGGKVSQKTEDDRRAS